MMPTNRHHRFCIIDHSGEAGQAISALETIQLASYGSLEYLLLYEGTSLVQLTPA
jgi:hypothetical protein